MKKTLLLFTFLTVVSSLLYSLNNPTYTIDLEEKNNINITVTCNDQPLDSVKVVILDDKVVLGYGWTNSEGIADVTINDVSGLTVNIKATKKGYETFFLKGGLLSSSTSFQIDMHSKTDNPNPTNFLEFQLEKENIKQPK
tara:strand:+ start:194 stop:613 length:420 start_codon:yes stop_codon:yes gene_type:complete